MTKKQRYIVFIFVAENSMVEVGKFATKVAANRVVKRLFQNATIGAGDRLNIAVWDSTKSWYGIAAWETHYEEAQETSNGELCAKRF